MNKTNTHELISALADGQLSAQERDLALEALAHDPQALARWEQYHVLGDVLRSAELAASTPSAEFMQRLSARLAQEPQPAVPAVRIEPVTVAGGIPAANEPVFRWKLVAGFASVAAAAAVGWNLLGGAPAPALAPQPGPQLAVAPMASPVASAALPAAPSNAATVMIRDPRLDELLAAHQQLGGAGPLPMPAAFARHATFEQSNR